MGHHPSRLTFGMFGEKTDLWEFLLVLTLQYKRNYLCSFLTCMPLQKWSRVRCQSIPYVFK